MSNQIIGPAKNPGLRADFRESKLISLLAEYSLTLPRNAIEWRVPPEPQSGYISGITKCSIRLLITDGILGWFAYDDGTTLLGHMQHFVRDRETKARLAEANPRKHTKKPVDPRLQALADED